MNSDIPPLQYREYPPPSNLAFWVDCVWTLSCARHVGERLRHWVLPDGCSSLLFWLPQGLPSPVEPLPILVGPTGTAFQRPVLPGEKYFGIRFRPGGLAALFEFTSQSFREVTLPLATVNPPLAARFIDRLAGARSSRDGLNRILQVVLEHRVHAANLDPLAMSAAEWLRRYGSHRPLRECVAATGLSERHFRRRFEAAVGFSPKIFVRLARLQAALRRSVLQPNATWGQLAARTGFADQAHLIREFQSIAGTTPTSYQAHLRQFAHRFVDLTLSQNAPVLRAADLFKTHQDNDLLWKT